MISGSSYVYVKQQIILESGASVIEGILLRVWKHCYTYVAVCLESHPHV